MSVITIQRTIKRKSQPVSPARLPLRDVARRFLTTENHSQTIIEALLFAILLAISSWPIVSAADAINQLLGRGGA